MSNLETQALVKGLGTGIIHRHGDFKGRAAPLNSLVDEPLQDGGADALGLPRGRDLHIGYLSPVIWPTVKLPLPYQNALLFSQQIKETALTLPFPPTLELGLKHPSILMGEKSGLNRGRVLEFDWA